MQDENVVSLNILPSHMTSTKTTIAIAFSQNAMITSFLFKVHVSSHTKCNIHVNGKFHMKVILLALPAHHLLTLS
jgi:hypothetical protein